MAQGSFLHDFRGLNLWSDNKIKTRLTAYIHFKSKIIYKQAEHRLDRHAFKKWIRTCDIMTPIRIFHNLGISRRCDGLGCVWWESEERWKFFHALYCSGARWLRRIYWIRCEDVSDNRGAIRVTWKNDNKFELRSQCPYFEPRESQPTTEYKFGCTPGAGITASGLRWTCSGHFCTRSNRIFEITHSIGFNVTDKHVGL